MRAPWPSTVVCNTAERPKASDKICRSPVVFPHSERGGSVASGDRNWEATCRRPCAISDSWMPLDLSRISGRDESYWDLHRATPRLFLNFALTFGICGLWLLLSLVGLVGQSFPRPLLRWIHQRRGRCVGEAALLSAGAFLALGIGGYVPQMADPADPHSGTGGFRWFLQTSLPVSIPEVSWPPWCGPGRIHGSSLSL